jgi:hypothetical protein
MANFGTLLAGTISVALVADFLLMPALVLTFQPYGPDRSGAAAAQPSNRAVPPRRSG